MIKIEDGNYTHAPELPKATGHMNYPGDCRHIIGEVKGPNLLDEMLTAVDAKYDPETNMTRVGFAYGVHLSEDEKKAMMEVGALDNYDPYR